MDVAPLWCPVAGLRSVMPPRPPPPRPPRKRDASQAAAEASEERDASQAAAEAPEERDFEIPVPRGLMMCVSCGSQ